MQSNFFLLNKIIYYVFSSSTCNFIIIPKSRENNKENTEVVRPNNCLFLTLIKILAPKKTVKNTVDILLE